jgi:predicted nucleic acid-binding protein
VTHNLLPRASLIPALTAIEGVEVELVRPLTDTNRLVLQWAERLGQNKVNDAHYLAASEQLSAEVWTADQRLANKAGQLGLSWVHGVAELL